MPSIDFLDKEREEQIYELLIASERPIKARILAEQVDTSVRVVRRLIRNLIARGFLIGSSMEPPHGYFILRTQEDYNHYVRQLKSRIKQIAGRLADVDRNAANQAQQTLAFSKKQEELC